MAFLLIYFFVLNLFFNFSLVVKSEYVIGCYYTNWAQHRKEEVKFLPKNIDPHLCTHSYFAFANIDLDKMKLAPFEKNDVAEGAESTAPCLYEEFNKLKRKNPQMKTLLSLGGASAGVEKFRKLIGSDDDRKKFIKNTIETLRKYNFDGLDLDWEFPETQQDKTGFTKLVKDFRLEFQSEAFVSDKPRLLLTAAVAVWKPKVEAGYEPQKLAQYLDYINLMAYDYHGSWNQRTGHNSPLFARTEQTGDQILLNQESTINTWIELGAPADKLVLGLAMYGRTFTLKTKKMNGMNAPASDAGKSGPYTQAAGFLSYFEVCKLLKDGWTKEWNDEQKVPYAFKDDQWVGYDDPKSIKLKCEYAVKRKLAGAMIWSLDLDDFNGGFCNEGKYPLLASIKSTFDKLTPPTTHRPLTTTTASNGLSYYLNNKNTRLLLGCIFILLAKFFY